MHKITKAGSSTFPHLILPKFISFKQWFKIPLKIILLFTTFYKFYNLNNKRTGLAWKCLEYV